MVQVAETRFVSEIALSRLNYMEFIQSSELLGAANNSSLIQDFIVHASFRKPLNDHKTRSAPIGMSLAPVQCGVLSMAGERACSDVECYCLRKVISGQISTMPGKIL